MAESAPKEVSTGVDDLIHLLEGVDRLALEDAAKKLGISPIVLQSWVDFLVEEKILGMEFKFTKPYIYLNKDKKHEKSSKKKREGKFDIAYFKEEFERKARQNNIPEAKIEDLWQHHLESYLTRTKDYFYKEAAKHNIKNTDAVWENYRRKVLV